MASKNQNDNNRTNEFQEHLRFFQSQVDKTKVPASTVEATPAPIKEKRNKNHCLVEEKYQIVCNSRANNSVPSVDNILSNVKNLRSSLSVKNEKTSNTKMSNIYDPILFTENNSSVKINPIFDDGHFSEVTDRAEYDQTAVSHTTTESKQYKKQSLLSKFDPSLDFSDQAVARNKNDPKPASVSLKKIESQKPNVTNKALDNKSEIYELCKAFNRGSGLESKEPNTSNAAGNTKSNGAAAHSNKTLPEGKAETKNVSLNRTFGQCKEKLLQAEIAKTFLEHKLPFRDDFLDPKFARPDGLKDIDSSQNADSSLDKQSISFESDYDSHDFVVHKANISEDYLESMSEDNYSLVNEDYEVEHPPSDPHIPSPDYNSEDDEEYFVQHSQYDSVELVDNGDAYDVHRYGYYPEDKELEMIPEEDEDDLDDYEMYDHPYPTGISRQCTQSSDDSRSTNHGECDSGLTDDQKSSSTTTEDCDLDDDTDSAKGSLPLQDSCTESPTSTDTRNVFPGYTKLYQTHATILEDFEKGKDLVKGGGNSQRPTTKSAFNVVPLLHYLYRINWHSSPEKIEPYINKSGYVEMLPNHRREATIGITWKKTYLEVKNGILRRIGLPNLELHLMEGNIDVLDNGMIGVDDKKGNYVLMRFENPDEAASWETALRTQVADFYHHLYTSPMDRYSPLLNFDKKVIVIDLGGSSVRAGILRPRPSLPDVFYPSVCATLKNGKKIFGTDALDPSIRESNSISYPLRLNEEVAKYNIDVRYLPALLEDVFQKLNVQPEEYLVQLNMPRNISDRSKGKIARLLLWNWNVKGLNVTHQAISSLHAYNTTTGIIVDVGERVDIIPIIDGYIVERGVSRHPYGAQRMMHHLRQALNAEYVWMMSDVENYLVRAILEDMCYVAQDFDEEFRKYYFNPDNFKKTLNTSQFLEDQDLVKNQSISLDKTRFSVSEGLWDPNHWGLDIQGVHKLVLCAIRECGMDVRKQMSRSVYLSGGLTLLPGFGKRLQKELNKLSPTNVTPKVHGSVHRYHMSYIGACKIALDSQFEGTCVTKKMWKDEGPTCIKKWHI